MAGLQGLRIKKRQKTFNCMEKIAFLVPVLSQIRDGQPGDGSNGATPTKSVLNRFDSTIPIRRFPVRLAGL